MHFPLVSFDYPFYLGLLLLLPGAWMISRRSLANLPRAVSTTALGLRFLIVTLVVLALAGLAVSAPSRRLAVLFVLDRSASVPPRMLEEQVRFVNESAAGMRAGDTAGVLVFGRDPHLEIEPRRDLRMGDIQWMPAGSTREFTDISAAIRHSLVALPEDAQRRIILLSDGNENLGDAAREAAAAAAGDVQVDVVPVRYQHGREVLVDSLSVKPEARVGETVPVTLAVIATEAGPATVTLLQNGEVRTPRKRVHLKQGWNSVEFTLTLERPDFHTLEAIVEPAGSRDTMVQNNSALGFTYVRGRPRVLIIAGEKGGGKYLATALKTQKMNVQLLSPGQVPGTLAQLQSYDSVILDNVSADQLGLDQMRMLASNVRDLGAGLVMVGGEHSFGPGAYRGTPIEEVLPVDMDVRKEKVMPTGAVAMVLHTCEFPEGNRWARETAAQVVDALGERDRVGVLVYDGGGNRWGVPMQETGDKDRIKSEIYSLDPGDMPEFHQILSMAFNGLKDLDAAVKHVIVITDGDPQPPAPELLLQMADKKISISTVAVNPHGTGTGVVEDMAAATGGRFYLVTSPEQIPRIFLKEAQRVLKPAIIERTFVPRVDPGSELIPGIPAPPPLFGYVATSLKGAPGVEAAMLSDQRDPILASWRCGLGRAVAFTSDAKNKWGAAWIGAWGGNYARFWSQVVRWTLRSSAPAEFDTNLRIQRDRGHLRADIVDPKGKFINQLRLSGSIASDRHQSGLTLDQTGPGRYEADFAMPEKGQYVISLTYPDRNGVQRVHTLGAAIPYSPEYRDLETNQGLLDRLARVTGGQLHTPLGVKAPPEEKEQLFRRSRLARSAPLALWPYLLLAALLIFPLDVAVRRVMLSWKEIAVPVRSRLVERREGREQEARDRGGEPGRPPSVHDRLRAAKAGAARPPSMEPSAPAGERPLPGTDRRDPPPAPEVREPGSGAGSRQPDTGNEPHVSPSAAPAQDGEGEHTRRLLEAKRRARRENDQETG